MGIAEAAAYEGAGTVEFLYTADGEFHFLEMNTRIQVEHPVTELVYGVDLIAEQLSIAAGQPLSLRQNDLLPTGHAIECRLCAEDAARGFLPETGRIAHLHEPSGDGIRVDSGLYPGQDVTAAFDPLLAKLVSFGATRQEAIDIGHRGVARLRGAWGRHQRQLPRRHSRPIQPLPGAKPTPVFWTATASNCWPANKRRKRCPRPWPLPISPTAKRG